jgi:predicted nicotinamide N-methyase
VPSPPTHDALTAFVRSQTAPETVSLCPELRLQTAQALTPFWEAANVRVPGWENAPFWAYPWAGGQALARFVLDHPELVRGKRVVDFASGSGLVGLAAALAGAAHVLASDIDPFCAAVIPMNAALNGLEIEFTSRDLLGDPLDGVDLLLAGDVFYERSLAERSLAWFQGLVRGGHRVLAGDPGRIYSPQQGTADRAEYQVPCSMEIEARSMVRTWVLELLP